MNNQNVKFNIGLVQNAIKNYHDSIGKETKPHHFINEARLVRFAMTGSFKATFDYKNLTREQQRMLRRVLCMDCRLIKSHVDYKLRKEACRELVTKNQRKKQT